MRSFVLFLVLFIMVGGAFAQTPTPTPAGEAAVLQPSSPVKPDDYQRPDKAARRKQYFKSLFSLGALGRNVAGAAWSTWRNTPEEWGGQWKGFGKRVASNFGKSVIKNSTAFALEEAFGLDSRYIKSKKRDFGSKVKNAVISPFVARNREGKLVPGIPRIAGTYAASIIANEVWYPKGHNWKDGLRSGTISFGTSILFNLFKEFWRR